MLYCIVLHCMYICMHVCNSGLDKRGRSKGIRFLVTNWSPKSDDLVTFVGFGYVLVTFRLRFGFGPNPGSPFEHTLLSRPDHFSYADRIVFSGPVFSEIR